MINRRVLGPALVALAVMAVIFGGLVWLLVASSANKHNDTSSISKLTGADNLQLDQPQLTPSREIVGGDLSVTGGLQVSDGLSGSSVTIAPTTSDQRLAGQLYVTTDNSLHYFDGSDDIDFSQISQIAGLTTQVNQLSGIAGQINQLGGLSGQLGGLS
ncbi:MAG TPA: hypothetical protein VFK03_00655, partial [Candidatus Saccharimonadales bacterium]|nr:hypothetical protein [Candidatus Saccharimonadales bacterium]